MAMNLSDANKPIHFVALEEEVLAFWQQEQCFERSVMQRKGSPLFSFYDGPPFATGLPHYGHILAGTIKDVIPRYKTMKGFFVPRRFGWDCHGVPIEYEIEKTLGLSGPKAIDAYGIAAFNDACRQIVLRYSKEWKTRVERMGRWVDFSRTYHTMDLSFMESVWWVFKTLFEKGLVYEGYKVMPFSTALGTPLSNFEASSHYQELQEPSAIVAFPLEKDERAVLAWTTTPWTLPSNLALMVNPQSTYATVLYKGKQYIVAEPRVKTIFKEDYEVTDTYLGEQLIGLHYRPPFSYFNQPTAFRIIEEPTVSMEEGTGVVHCAPGFGEVDFYACKRAGIDLVCPVDNSGCFTEEVSDFAGQPVRQANKAILRILQESGRLFSQFPFNHRVPFCWRSDTPLIYKAVNTWFVAVEQIKEKLLHANQQIHWVPEHIKEGRFGKWLENARDWAISRNRYWGTPIPIWRAKSGAIHVVGSIKELSQLTGEVISDLHRDKIDHCTFTMNGEAMERIPEVFDCWFESGSMPYAEQHFPFENLPLHGFPADFIAEGTDQTRGWFYTLTVLAAALFDKPAFLNVIVNGIILAEDGNKMSKRLKNYPEPERVVNKYGADALRLYLLNSPAVKGDDLRFSEHGVEQQIRQVLAPLWNAYTFFKTYTDLYSWKLTTSTALMDQWILAELNRTVARMHEAMERYTIHEATQELALFVDALTNWYIRRSRERFWQEAEEDRNCAFSTLHTVLMTIIKAAAPFIPFLTESLFQRLKRPEDPLSVHFCEYPEGNNALRNPQLEMEMALTRRVVSLGHFLRKENQLKVRQPLRTLHIALSKELQMLLEPYVEVIRDELNVKQVLFCQEDRFASFTAKPNFRILGKKVGAKMPLAQQAIQKLTSEKLKTLEEEGSLSLHLEDGTPLVLTKEDIEIQRQVIPGVVATHQEGITLALETTIDKELLLEGLAREFRSKVNMMRRQAGLAVSDRIHLKVEASPLLEQAVETHQKSLKEDLLALTLLFVPCKEGTEWEIGEEFLKVELQRNA